ncbi:hypothetical protein ACHAWU_007114 [Discostella pseudostelligera]|uniref:NADP-dependent oxidoreductase domain-containing protein n=1 Tax=Discostella pseudostelligera TaxID=259834 RepID=A0ABD3LXG8_9STRA
MNSISYGSCGFEDDSTDLSPCIISGSTQLGEEGGKLHRRALIAVLVSVSLFVLAHQFHINHPQETLAQSAIVPLQSSMSAMMSSNHDDPTIIPNPNAYPRRPFITRNGRNVFLPVLGFPSVALAQYVKEDDQHLANEAVRHAVEDLQISYFDVAPEYGDGVAQQRLGPALQPYRHNVFLAAKTMYRDANGSATDLANTLRALQTDHLDLYQFHSISTDSDVAQILGEGGAMETFVNAKNEGKIHAIGFSAHSEAMAVKMIESGLVDTCMFPINFVAYHYGGVGQKVLDAAMKYNVGVIALKSGARGRLTPENGEAVHVPESFDHIPEWKRKEMIDYPVVTSRVHHTWYEPEDDPEELNRLILWSLNQLGVTATLPPGSLLLLDGISDMLRGKSSVPKFDEADMEHMLERYDNIVPIFHNRSISGTKVST